MKPGSIAIVGAAETTRLGVIPDMSQIQLHADCALNAMRDAGLKPSDIDGLACAGESPTNIAHYLGIVPTWVDGTGVGGCSFMLHVRHATAAISAGLCKTVLITHGESGRSRIGALPRSILPASLQGQFEAPFGIFGPPTIAFYGTDGEERRNFRVVGFMKAAEFAAVVRQAIAPAAKPAT